MQLLGMSLEDHFQESNRKFTKKTLCTLAISMISCIESVHMRHYIHRDIKPDNFAVGPGHGEHDMFILDFGLANQYWTGGQHIPKARGRGLVGTARYVAVNVHDGIEPSRRDDLEAICFVLMYFHLEGKLPWMGLHTSSKYRKYKEIGNIKRRSGLTLTPQFPELQTHLQYCRDLAFEDEPDYAKFLSLYQDCMARDDDVAVIEERRIDPMLAGEAVTFAQMRQGLSDQGLDEEQLQQHWSGLRSAGQDLVEPTAPPSTAFSAEPKMGEPLQCL